MKTKLKDIKAWLKSDNIPYEYDNEDKVIMIFNRDTKSTQLHIVKFDKTTDMFQWHMHAIYETDSGERKHLDLKNNPHKDMILEYILVLNYQSKIGSWEYSPNDGGIHFYLGLPLDNTRITKEQFDKVKEVMLKHGDEGTKGIAYISENGKIPK